MRRTRYFLLIASMLLHVGLLLLIMNIRLGGAQIHHEKDEINFVAEMKVPTKPVVTDPANVVGGASAAPAPTLVSPQAPPPSTITITSATTPSFNTPITSTSTLNTMTRALNNLTAAERAGHGSGMGQGVNIGGVTVSDGEKLGVVLDVSGSMTFILPPIRKTLADNFSSCVITEATNSFGQYMQGGSGINGNMPNEPDLYRCCYKLLEQQVTAIYMFTDFEDGEDKKATDAMVEDLRKAGVKLYLCYTEGPPYDKLIKYSQESGGECKKFVREKKEPSP